MEESGYVKEQGNTRGRDAENEHQADSTQEPHRPETDCDDAERKMDRYKKLTTFQKIMNQSHLMIYFCRKESLKSSLTTLPVLINSHASAPYQTFTSACDVLQSSKRNTRSITFRCSPMVEYISRPIILSLRGHL